MKNCKSPKDSDPSEASDAQKGSEQDDPTNGDLTPIPKDPDSILPPELLERLPKNVREVVLRAASFRGPLPPSEMFREYEDVVPGSGDRIIKIAENQQAHRIQWEETALVGESRSVARGQWFGFIVALACIGSAVYLGVNDQVVVPGILVGIGGSGLVGQLVNSFRNEKDK